MRGEHEARLFVAIELPAEPVRRLVSWGREAAGVLGAGRSGLGLRVLDAESLHLTLCFLGARPVDEIPELLGALTVACEGFAPLELALGAPVWLPPRGPRALAVEVRERSGELARLQRAVELALEGGGGGSRRYRPHVTVARTRADFRAPNQVALPVTPAGAFTGERVALLRSWLEPRGARYEAQGAVTLDPSGA